MSEIGRNLIKEEQGIARLFHNWGFETIMAENGNIVALMNYIIVTRKSSYSLKKPSFSYLLSFGFSAIIPSGSGSFQAENNITKAVWFSHLFL